MSYLFDYLDIQEFKDALQKCIRVTPDISKLELKEKLSEYYKLPIQTDELEFALNKLYLDMNFTLDKIQTFKKQTIKPKVASFNKSKPKLYKPTHNDKSQQTPLNSSRIELHGPTPKTIKPQQTPINKTKPQLQGPFPKIIEPHQTPLKRNFNDPNSKRKRVTKPDLTSSLKKQNNSQKKYLKEDKYIKYKSKYQTTSPTLIKVHIRQLLKEEYKQGTTITELKSRFPNIERKELKNLLDELINKKVLIQKNGHNTGFITKKRSNWENNESKYYTIKIEKPTPEKSEYTYKLNPNPQILL